MSQSRSPSFFWVTRLVGFGIIISFGLTIPVGVVSRIRPDFAGGWPNLEIGEQAA